MLRAQLAHGLQIVFLHRHHAAFALHAFKQHGADLGVSELRFQVFHVVALCVHKALGQRGEKLMKAVLTRCCQCGERSAVEGIFQCDNLIRVLLVAVLTGDLNGALVCLRAAVAEERTAKAAVFCKQLRKLRVFVAVIVVRHVLDLARLLGDGLHPALIAVTQRIHADAGGKIIVMLAFHVPSLGVFAVAERHVHTAVGMEDILLFLLFNCFKTHIQNSFCFHNIVCTLLKTYPYLSSTPILSPMNPSASPIRRFRSRVRARFFPLNRTSCRCLHQ